MQDFFKYKDLSIGDSIFHNLTFLEWIIPLSVFYMAVMFMIIYRQQLLEKPIMNKTLRSCTGSILTFLLLMHHVLLISQNKGFDFKYLPLNIMSVNAILAIILVFSKSKKIFSFLIYFTILGSVVSLIYTNPGYSFHYFRYYSFMLIHGITVLIPLYFMIVMNYTLTFKDAVKTIVIAQIVGISVFVFNLFVGTEFMNLTVKSNNVVQSFGGFHWFVIIGEIILIVSISIIFGIINYISYINKKSRSSVNTRSHYMTQKKQGFFN